MEERIDKLDIIKDVCTVTDSVKRMKRKPQTGSVIFVKDISDKRILSKIFKELLKVKIRRQITDFKNGPKTPQTPHPKGSINGK